MSAKRTLDMTSDAPDPLGTTVAQGAPSSGAFKPTSPPLSIRRMSRETKAMSRFEAGAAPPPVIAHKMAKEYPDLPPSEACLLVAIEPPEPTLPPPKTSPPPKEAQPPAEELVTQQQPKPAAAQSLEAKVASLEEALEKSRERSKLHVEKKLQMEKERDAARQEADSLELQLKAAREQLGSLFGDPDSLIRITSVEEIDSLQSALISGLARINEHRSLLAAGYQSGGASGV